MRTALYIYQPSVVTIHAVDPRDTKCLLCRYNQTDDQPAVGTHKLDPGIYMIISNGALKVEAANIDIVAMPRDKDPWPDPKAKVLALESNASAESIQEFFQIAYDVSLDD